MSEQSRQHDQSGESDERTAPGATGDNRPERPGGGSAAESAGAVDAVEVTEAAETAEAAGAGGLSDGVEQAEGHRDAHGEGAGAGSPDAPGARSPQDPDGTQNAGGAAAGQAQAPAETTQTAQTGSTAGTSGTAGAATQAAAPPRRRLRTRRRRTGGARAGSGTRRTGPRSWRHLARRSTAAVSALVLVAAVAGLTRWGRGAPAPTQPPVKAMTITDKGARTTYVCPAQPADTLAVTDKAPTTARTVITPLGQSRSITYRGEDLRVDAATSLGAGDGGVLTMEPAGDQAVSAASAVTTLTTGGDLRGLTAAPCTQPSAVAWIVGGSADLGASADLRLDNPGVTAVTAKVTLYGSSGRLSLPSNGEVTIPAGKSESMLLETSGSQDERIAISIEADGGSLVPSLVTESLDGETAAGVDVLTPGAAPSTSLTIPGVQVLEAAKQGDAADESSGAASSESSVVRVANPHDEPASVSITMLGPEGPTPLPGAQEVEIDPGSVFDLSLKGVEPGTYGVQVTSDRDVAAAVRLVRSAGEYPARSGSLVHDEAWIQPAAEGSLSRAVLAVPRGEGLTSAVTLANSGAQRTISLAAVGGDWRKEVTLPAGGATAVEVPAEVTALTLTAQGQAGSTGDAEGLAAATIVTAEATGEAAGTLISVIPALADATVGAQRTILLG